jgi:hypothetical protein
MHMQELVIERALALAELELAYEARDRDIYI